MLNFAERYMLKAEWQMATCFFVIDRERIKGKLLDAKTYA